MICVILGLYLEMGCRGSFGVAWWCREWFVDLSNWWISDDILGFWRRLCSHYHALDLACEILDERECSRYVGCAHNCTIYDISKLTEFQSSSGVCLASPIHFVILVHETGLIVINSWPCSDSFSSFWPSSKSPYLGMARRVAVELWFPNHPNHQTHQGKNLFPNIALLKVWVLHKILCKLGLVLVWGREDIWISRERPLKSWWNIMPVTSDATKTRSECTWKGKGRERKGYVQVCWPLVSFDLWLLVHYRLPYIHQFLLPGSSSSSHSPPSSMNAYPSECVGGCACLFSPTSQQAV